MENKAVAGCTLFKGECLVLDVEQFRKNWHHGRRSIHHELFHAIDFNDDPLGLLDPWWETLNEQGFRYKNLPKGTPVRTGFAAGFASNYAMQSVAEDKAELFAHLIVDCRNIHLRAQSDAVLGLKVKRMKQLLRTFTSEFNEEFWKQRRDASSLSILFNPRM